MSAPLALTIILVVLICLTTATLALALLILYRVWQHVLNLQYLVSQLTKIVRVDQERNHRKPSSPASSTGMKAPYPIPSEPPISWPLERIERRTPAAHPGARFPPPADRYSRPSDRNADPYSLPATRESSPRSFI
ncbi:hypothetical protein KC349_g1287 [Hortaea werneckii]|nr:hypothetical protein KC349_g1287 [Hortaea werneckii]